MSYNWKCCSFYPNNFDASALYQDGLYVHRSCGTFFQEDGAKKEMTLMLGNEWKGGDTMDDLC